MSESQKIFSITILGILVIILLLTNIRVLILEDLTDQKIVFLEKIAANDEFTMQWIHSVELQPWEEVFKVNTDYNIILDRTRFKSFGAGVPAYAGKKTEVKDGYVVFSDINKPMSDLQYRASNLAQHAFYFRDKELKLYELVGDENIIRIYTLDINIIKYLKFKIAASI
ncbi:DUF1850 domain-containing protein [Wukongibacter baidiensis]|uniref:DUF1850 domain-containing protein n=1 Tax=Wukongibacter baidiensis TaxID=1723361 RepID=UPI003D7F7933